MPPEVVRIRASSTVFVNASRRVYRDFAGMVMGRKCKDNRLRGGRKDCHTMQLQDVGAIWKRHTQGQDKTPIKVGKVEYGMAQYGVWNVFERLLD